MQAWPIVNIHPKIDYSLDGKFPPLAGKYPNHQGKNPHPTGKELWSGKCSTSSSSLVQSWNEWFRCSLAAKWRLKDLGGEKIARLHALHFRPLALLLKIATTKFWRRPWNWCFSSVVFSIYLLISSCSRRTHPYSPPSLSYYLSLNKMATRGIQQLQKLRIRYCEHGGSSAPIRQYLQQSPTTPNGTPNHLFQFATNNPAIQIIIQPRNGHHPYIQGEYRTGTSKQICIKNCTPQRIEQVMSMLVNTSGRKITRLGGLAVRGDCMSVQGVWTPMLNLGQGGEKGSSSFDIKINE